MVNSKIYINEKRIVDFDKFTAEYEDGKRYVFGVDEYEEFMKQFDIFVDLPNDSMNMFSTHRSGRFLFTDCRRDIKDVG